MNIDSFLQAVLPTNTIYALINDEDDFAQIESEQSEQSDGSLCMVQLLFADEQSCRHLTNLQFTSYKPTPLPISEIMEFLIAIDESGGLVMLNPTADMNEIEHEPIDLYNAIGEKLGLFEDE
jgi:Protein of unknown function (DUF2750)